MFILKRDCTATWRFMEGRCTAQLLDSTSLVLDPQCPAETETEQKNMQHATQGNGRLSEHEVSTNI